MLKNEPNIDKINETLQDSFTIMDIGSLESSVAFYTKSQSIPLNKNVDLSLDIVPGKDSYILTILGPTGNTIAKVGDFNSFGNIYDEDAGGEDDGNTEVQSALALRNATRQYKKLLIDSLRSNSLDEQEENITLANNILESQPDTLKFENNVVKSLKVLSGAQLDDLANIQQIGDYKRQWTKDLKAQFIYNYFKEGQLVSDAGGEDAGGEDDGNTEDTNPNSNRDTLSLNIDRRTELKQQIDGLYETGRSNSQVGAIYNQVDTELNNSNTPGYVESETILDTTDGNVALAIASLHSLRNIGNVIGKNVYFEQQSMSGLPGGAKPLYHLFVDGVESVEGNGTEQLKFNQYGDVYTNADISGSPVNLRYPFRV
jgi:hypothetical protein